MNKNLILSNANIVTDDGIKKVDILVKNGIIKKISKPSSIKLKNVLNLNLSKYLTFPGFIDVHTHFKLKIAENKYNSDDFISGTKACAAGGITTIIDFTHQEKGKNLISGLKERLKDAKKSYCDYSFHCIIPSIDKLKKSEKQIKKISNYGVPTFKIFTAYKKRGLMLEKNEILKLFKIAKKNNLIICIHAESENIINSNIKKLKDKIKKLGMKAHILIRNHKTEEEAVSEIINLNKKIKAKIYFVHISSANSAKLIKKAQYKKIPVMAETCPQYLVLNDKIYSLKNSHLYGFCPPTRTKRNNNILWKAISSGIISNISTDSCAFTKKQKDTWKRDINNLYMGIASSQLLFPLIYTYGVKKGKISISMLKNVISTNPAKIMGIEKKGEIKEGNIADFAIFDINKKFKVSWKKLYHKCDYSPYQNMILWGSNKYTILRGNIIAKNGKIIGKPQGRYIKRHQSYF